MINTIRNYFSYRRAVRIAEQRRASIAFLRSFYREVHPVDEMTDGEVEQLWKEACAWLAQIGLTCEDLLATRI